MRVVAEGPLQELSRSSPSHVLALSDAGDNYTIELGSRRLAATLVKLPCIIESMKTSDKAVYTKVGDISRLMFVFDREFVSEEDKKGMLKEHVGEILDREFGQVCESGITPPTRHIVQRRFDRTKQFRKGYTKEELSRGESVLHELGSEKTDKRGITIVEESIVEEEPFMTDAWGEHFKLVYVDGSLSEVKVETKGDVSWRKRGTDSVAQPSHLLEEAQEAIEDLHRKKVEEDKKKAEVDRAHMLARGGPAPARSPAGAPAGGGGGGPGPSAVLGVTGLWNGPDGVPVPGPAGSGPVPVAAPAAPAQLLPQAPAQAVQASAVAPAPSASASAPSASASAPVPSASGPVPAAAPSTVALSSAAPAAGPSVGAAADSASGVAMATPAPVPVTAVAEVDPETQAKHARLKVLQDELAAASLRLVKAVNPVLQARVKAEVEAKQKEVDRAKGELGIL